MEILQLEKIFVILYCKEGIDASKHRKLININLKIVSL